jgi:hypothetical protein
MTAMTIALGLIPIRAATATMNTGDLGGLLDSFTASDKTFTIRTDSRLYIVSQAAPSGDLLQTAQLIQQQLAAMGTPVTAMPELVWGDEAWAKPGDIVLNLDPDSALTEDGYSLIVDTMVTITAKNARGLLYGANTLMKHLRYAATGTIQGFTAQDEPDTKQRAVSLDCGRKYYTKNWICNFIRQISWMGYNTLELHFSDDSGFRIDIWDDAIYTDHYQPANDFTWLCGSNYTSWTEDDYRNDPDKGKYLTATELVEILNTAKQYHIDVIPAFDSPSHLDYTTWKFEQNYDSNNSYSFYSTYDKKTYYASEVNGIINYTGAKDWATDMQTPYYTAVNIVDAQAKAFVFELYIDIANFFREYAGSTDFSIGADEVRLDDTNLASGYSFKWGFPDFVNYINELNRLLNDMGYTMRMYNDFMGSTAFNASSYAFDKNIEILYWDSPFQPNNGKNKAHTEPVSYFVDQGRTLYNCIQTNTYYVLRITSDGDDARSKNTTWFTFYHSTEDSIYNEWYSADISEHGKYAENTADIPEENLGGAYFLIWSDYACISTEQEIWEGCYATTSKNKGEYYNLLDRMWSNIIKMWNWDINDSLSFTQYAALRDAQGDFPGIGSGKGACSKAVSLPGATEAPAQAWLADHSALTAALNKNLPYAASGYTEESYNAYLAVRKVAEDVNADHGATEEELQVQLDRLNSAVDTLELRPLAVTVELKTMAGDTVKDIGTLTGYTYGEDRRYSIYVPVQMGYVYSRAEDGTFTPLDSGDGSGYLTGSTQTDTTITVWYESKPDRTWLDSLVRNADTNNSFYTAAAWAAYQAALNAARNLTILATTTQEELNQAAQDITNARNGLVSEDTAPEILHIQLLNPVMQRGKQVGLRVTTSAGVASLWVEGQTLSVCTSAVQTDSDGELVKIWLLCFPAKEAGEEITYTLVAQGGADQKTTQFKIQVN